MSSLLRVLAVLSAVLVDRPAAAVTFTVDSAVDAVDILPGDGVCADLFGECTLRAAVQETNALAGADEIVLPACTYLLTRVGIEQEALAGDLDVSDALTITGAGAATTIVDGDDTNGVFDVRSGSLAMSGTTVRRGLQENGRAGGIDAPFP